MLEGYMDMQQFTKLVEYIQKNHKWGKGKGVKYIDPVFDMRTNRIFAIKFRGMFKDKDFAIVNENKHKDLEAWVYDWLDEDK